MNWGIKIIAAYSLFVAGIMVLVIKSMNEEHELVVTDYYAQELKYQEKLDASRRTTDLKGPVDVRFADNHFNITFPTDSSCSEINGNIHIYCASDRTKDQNGTFVKNKDEQVIKYPYTGYGFRKIEISWKKNGLTYFTEKEIFIQ